LSKTATGDPTPALAPAGLALWNRIVADYELTPREQAILTEACRVAEVIAVLDAHLLTEGITVTGSTGQRRLHPAIAEIRQQRALLGQLLGRLALPIDHDGQGILDLPGLRATGTERTSAARRAALTRWHG